MVEGYKKLEGVQLKENSAVIVFDQDGDKHSFQLMLPGMMEYKYAPRNVKQAVVISAFLRYDDQDFRELVKAKGQEYYDRYIAETVVEDLPKEKE